MDGMSAIMLATCGAVDQYKACGLDTVHDQMKFRMLVVGGPNDSSCSASTSSNSLSSSSNNLKSSGKLRMKQLQSLAPEKKRGYLCASNMQFEFFFFFRRKKIKIAACETWPGNCIPTFRKGSSEMQQLESLVESLVQSSSCEYFGKRAIRSHILDTLAECRRQVRKGA